MWFKNKDYKKIEREIMKKVERDFMKKFFLT
jgi:hypothetical protein